MHIYVMSIWKPKGSTGQAQCYQDPERGCCGHRRSLLLSRGDIGNYSLWLL